MSKVIDKIGGRKIFLTYIIMTVICAVYIYMIYNKQVLQGDFSTFCTTLVALGIGYGTVNGISKMATKSTAVEK